MIKLMYSKIVFYNLINWFDLMKWILSLIFYWIDITCMYSYKSSHLHWPIPKNLKAKRHKVQHLDWMIVMITNIIWIYTFISRSHVNLRLNFLIYNFWKIKNFSIMKRPLKSKYWIKLMKKWSQSHS